MKEIENMKVVFDTEYFKELLKEKGLTQVKLAHMIGSHHTTICNYVSHRKMPYTESLYKMAMALDCQMEDLLREVYE